MIFPSLASGARTIRGAAAAAAGGGEAGPRARLRPELMGTDTRVYN